MLDINFLRFNLVKLKKQNKQDKTIYRYSLISFIIISIIFTALFSFRLYLSSQLNDVTAKQEDTIESINNQQEVETSFLIFTNKLKIIRELFEERADKQAAISYFTNLFGDGIYIEKMSFGGNGTTLDLTVSTDSIFILGNVFEKLKDPEIAQKFSFVNKNYLDRNEEGEYKLDLTISLIKPKNNDS